MSEVQLDVSSARLREYFRHAEGRDVHHARPSQIAHALHAPLRPILETLVEAMFNGDAILHWELECPSCKGIGEIPNLFTNPLHAATCLGCGAHFTVHADQEAQITFSVHPQLRELGPEADDSAYRHALHTHYPPTTVQELMTLQKFHDWAQNEPLQGNAYLEIRRMTLWFSDLLGSTALYAHNGDPFAYSLVREHFDLVEQAVQRAEGAVVKTIGDGIMAVFTQAKQGLLAALDANARLEAFNDRQALAGERRLQLKVGIHSGPAITVTLNNRLDYFGTTVNLASRVSNLARGREILLTQTAFDEPGMAELSAPYAVETFESEIRGLDEKITVSRIAI